MRSLRIWITALLLGFGLLDSGCCVPPSAVAPVIGAVLLGISQGMAGSPSACPPPAADFQPLPDYNSQPWDDSYTWDPLQAPQAAAPGLTTDAIAAAGDDGALLQDSPQAKP